MARESFAEAQIPATGSDDVPYAEQRAIARGFLGRATESFLAQGTGAGGSGFDVVNVPFEPAYIRAVNPAGANPAVHESYFTPTPAHTSVILATAANGTPPVLVKIGDNDWTVEIPVGMAPDAEVLTLLIVGVREVAPGL